MRETRFSTRLLLAAGAAAALIAAPVTVSPHALALSWQVAAAQRADGSYSNGRSHGNGGPLGNSVGHREDGDHAQGPSADRGQGRLHDYRGWHYGRSWHDDGGSVPVDDEAPPS